jgi:hypothetical protein
MVLFLGITYELVFHPLFDFAPFFLPDGYSNGRYPVTFQIGTPQRRGIECNNPPEDAAIYSGGLPFISSPQHKQ